MATQQKTPGHRARNAKMAARMKALKICRTTQTCPNCYRSVSCESWKSRYTHICRG